MSAEQAVRDAIEAATGTRPEQPPHPVGGGCINETFRLGDFFVKLNTLASAPMFEAERLALDAIQRSGTVRVPRPVCAGTTATHAFLVLEHLPLTSGSHRSQETLGRQLADLHRVTQPNFGWERDNFIGTTSQPNPATARWIDFLRDHRLGHMIRLAGKHGFPLRGGDTLLDRLDRFFTTGEPIPSMLHGDLWGGNAAALPDETPVVFDPATYFGDREADLAMTRLFGGFSPSFHAAYEEAWPLAPGHENRCDLYNLYHLLNHAVLFGGGYQRQAQAMIDSLLARCDRA
jgi:fructosamine-3-kinase